MLGCVLGVFPVEFQSHTTFQGFPGFPTPTRFKNKIIPKTHPKLPVLLVSVFLEQDFLL